MLRRVFSVMTMAALVAAPSFVAAQCTNCGNSGPVYSQPISTGSYNMPMSYGQPVNYGAPVSYAQPMNYSAPTYQNYPVQSMNYQSPVSYGGGCGGCGGAVSYAAPVMAGGCNGCGGQSFVSAPMMNSGCGCGQSMPVYSGCGGCGGQMMGCGGQVMGCGGCGGQVVYGGGMMGSGCSNCGGVPMSGVIVGDGAMPVEPMANGVVSPSDVVSPPQPVEQENTGESTPPAGQDKPAEDTSGL